MRIAFICGRLGPGADGVGDYVRLLSGGLAARGHSVLALALRDSATAPETGPAGERFVRYADTALTPASARAALAAFAPDWVSLQWVPYAWHPRGLPWFAGARLAAISPATARRHFMAHELWVGENDSAPTLDRLLWCPLQRLLTRRLLAVWRPALVHTSIPIYATLLARLGRNAVVLPLPGNLPSPGPDDSRWAEAWLRAHGLSEDRFASLAAVFGTLHPEWEPDEALLAWNAHERAAGRQPALLALGRIGLGGESRLARLRSAVPGLAIHLTGELPAGQIAALLARARFALATSPLALLGKSGTVAAARDLGLPVLVTRNDWLSRSTPMPATPDDPLIMLWPASGALDWPAFLARRRAQVNSAPALTLSFISDLTAA